MNRQIHENKDENCDIRYILQKKKIYEGDTTKKEIDLCREMPRKLFKE